MNIQLTKFHRDGQVVYATYEGEHSTPGRTGTSFSFQIELSILGSQVMVQKISGFEHLRADSIPGIFSEIARLTKRMTTTLEHCASPGVALPIRMEHKNES